MKRLIGSIAVCLFAIIIFGISIASVLAQTSPAKGESQEKVLLSPTPSPIVKPLVDYYLPYPGILPDQILYKLKAVRDRISLLMTFDPIAKTEKLLLYADKRLGASKALIEGNKIEIGLTTATKAEKYLEQAITEVEKAKKAGRDVKALLEKLDKATLKHKEVLEGLALIVPDTYKNTLNETIKYPIQGNQNVVNIMRSN